MTIRKYTITDRLLISADELTPRQADAFWLDVVELADQHCVTLHGTRLAEVDGPLSVGVLEELAGRKVESK